MARDRAPFPVVRLRGYDIGQVNAFLKAAIAERRRLSAENETLRHELQAKSTELATRQPVSPATIVTADQAAAILASAQRTAELTIAQARHQAADTLRAAVERAEALAEASEQQLARTREDLAASQVRLVGLQALESEYRSRLRAWASGVLIDLDDGSPEARPPAHAQRPDSAAATNQARPSIDVSMYVDVMAGTATPVEPATEATTPEAADEFEWLDAVPDSEVVDPLDAARVGESEIDRIFDVPAGALAEPPAQPRSTQGRPPRSWFAPVGSPHRPAGV